MLNQLQDILYSPVLDNIDEIESIMDKMDDEADTDILISAANMIKDAVQRDAILSIVRNNNRGFIALPTGTGKTRVPIKAMLEDGVTNPSILIVVPTEKLRDSGWKEEFDKWEASHLWENTTRECYASLHKIQNKTFDYIILDEAHNITYHNMSMFHTLFVGRLFMLSATPPQDVDKKKILKHFGCKITYTMSLDTAVRLRLVAPYEINVIECSLDSTEKYLKAGSKKKGYFLNTEKNHYAYLSSGVNRAMFSKSPNAKFQMLKRMRFIYDLRSKVENAKFILSEFISPEERTIIFCGSKTQADTLCEYSYHSDTDDVDFNRFVSGEISRLACVKKVNEGLNIPNVETAVVVTFDSVDRNIIQRIGRLIRYKYGHIGRIIILVTVDTVEEKWLAKAIESFDKQKIRYARMINLRNGSDTIPTPKKITDAA